jgi:hypothetical protein
MKLYKTFCMCAQLIDFRISLMYDICDIYGFYFAAAMKLPTINEHYFLSERLFIILSFVTGPTPPPPPHCG